MGDLILVEKVPSYMYDRHFKQILGEEYCFRASCDECPYKKECVSEPAEVDISSEPNIRKALIARPGFCLAAVDFRGVELRAAGNMSKEPVWVNAFLNDLDLHGETAKGIFGPSYSKKERQMAKCVRSGTQVRTRVLVQEHILPSQEQVEVEVVEVLTPLGTAQYLSESGVKVLNARGKKLQKLMKDLQPGEFLLEPPQQGDRRYISGRNTRMGKSVRYLLEGLSLPQIKAVRAGGLEGFLINKVSVKTTTMWASESVGDIDAAHTDEHRPGEFFPLVNTQIYTALGWRTVAFLYFDGIKDFWTIKVGTEKVEISPGHRVWTRRDGKEQWISTEDLNAGSDEVQMLYHGNLVWHHFKLLPPEVIDFRKARAYEKQDKLFKSRDLVFDLVVPDGSEYLANNFRVHNCSNFSNLFGGSPYSLAKTAEIPLEQAKDVWGRWWQALRKLKEWVSQVHAAAKSNGYVKTILGRRRSLKQWYNSDDKKTIAFADRSALSTIVQGCLQQGVRVLTSRGYIKIGELWKLQEEKQLGNIKVWNGHRWCDFRVMNRGKSQLCNYHFSDGSVLEADVRHVLKKINATGVSWTGRGKIFEGDVIAQSLCRGRPFNFSFKSGLDYWVEPHKKVHNYKSVNKKGFLERISDVWYWVGRYYGDGYISRTQFTICSSGKEKTEVHSRMKKLFDNILGLHVFSRKSLGSKGESWQHRIDSVHLVDLLVKMGVKLGSNSHTKRFPDSIFQESLENRKAFIRGFWDADGSKKNRYNFGFHMCQGGILWDTQLLLRSCGVRSKVFNGKADWLLVTEDSDVFAQMLGLEEKKHSRHLLSRIDRRRTPQFLTKRFMQWFLKRYPFRGFRVEPEEAQRVLLEKVGCVSNIESRRKFRALTSIFPSMKVISYSYDLASKKAPLATLVSRLRRGVSVGLTEFYWLCHKIGFQVHDLEDTYDSVKCVKIEPLNRSDITFTLSLRDSSHAFDSNGVISKNSCADLMKTALASCHKFIVDHSLQSEVKMLLAIHDEIVFEIKQDQLKTHLNWIVPIMARTPKGWPAPLKLDVEVGPSWGEVGSLKDWEPPQNVIIPGQYPEEKPVLPPEKPAEIVVKPVSDQLEIELSTPFWKKGVLEQLRALWLECPGTTQIIFHIGGKEFGGSGWPCVNRESFQDGFSLIKKDLLL